MPFPPGTNAVIGNLGLAELNVNERSQPKASSNHTASPRYTSEEKKWLKKHWKGEFHFLAAHGLKMHSDEDREEGRGLARAFIEQDNSDEATEGTKAEVGQHTAADIERTAAIRLRESDPSTIPLWWEESNENPMTPEGLQVYSMANYSSAKGHLSYHAEKSDGSFGISIANGCGIFVSPQLVQRIALEHRPFPLCPPGLPTISGLVGDYDALGSILVDFILLDRLTNTTFRLKARAQVLKDLAVDMFIGFSTPFVNQMAIVGATAKLRLDLGHRHVLIY